MQLVENVLTSVYSRMFNRNPTMLLTPTKPSPTTDITDLGSTNQELSGVNPVDAFIIWVRESILSNRIGGYCVGCVTRSSTYTIVCLTMLHTIWDIYKADHPEVKGQFTGMHRMLLDRLTDEERQLSQTGELRHRFTDKEGWEAYVKRREAGELISPPYKINPACRMYPLSLFGLTLEDMKLYRKISSRASNVLSRDFVPHEILEETDETVNKKYQIGVNMHESHIAELKKRYPTLRPALATRKILQRVLPLIPEEDYQNDDLPREVIGEGKYERISNVILDVKTANLLRKLCNANRMDLTTMIKIFLFTDIFTKGVDLTFL